jgi:hypothetical protein
MREINKAFPELPFHYEGLDKVAFLATVQDWFFTIDLSQAYQHLLVHPELMERFGFVWKNRFFAFRVLPFGWRCSPYVWTQLMLQVVARWRQQGIRLVIYIDDLLVMASSLSEAIWARGIILEDMWLLGLFLSVKTQLGIVRVIPFLGFVLDFEASPPVWRVPREKLAKLAAYVQELPSNASGISARKLAKFLGFLISLQRALVPAKMMSRELFALFRQGQHGEWDREVVCSPAALEELAWWGATLPRWAANGRPIFPTHTGLLTVLLTVDASPDEWGAKLQGFYLTIVDALVVEELPNGSKATIANAMFEPNDSKKDQCEREILGALYSLQAFISLIHGRAVQIRSDNVATVAYINNEGGPSTSMTDVMRRIWELCLMNDVQLSATHIPGTTMIAEGVDFLSREGLVEPADWKLNPELFQWLDALWGPCTIDRFASAINVQHRLGSPLRFNSRRYEPGAEAVDAFAQNWAVNPHGIPEINWINPPFSLIPRVLTHMQAQQAKGILICPQIPTAWWWPLLLQCQKDTRQIPHARNIFLPKASANREPLSFPPFRVLAIWLNFAAQ